MDALVDSGFDGFVSLSPALIQFLGLRWLFQQSALLGNGQTVAMDHHELTVVWDGLNLNALVIAADTSPAIGMSLLDGYRLSIDVEPGGMVHIEKLP